MALYAAFPASKGYNLQSNGGNSSYSHVNKGYLRRFRQQEVQADYECVTGKTNPIKRDGKHLPSRCQHACQHGLTDLLPDSYRRKWRSAGNLHENNFVVKTSYFHSTGQVVYPRTGGSKYRVLIDTGFYRERHWPLSWKTLAFVMKDTGLCRHRHQPLFKLPMLVNTADGAFYISSKANY